MKISEFLRLRKQNDTVKLICILALTGTACLISAICHLWDIYRYVNLPGEYVLTGETTVTQKRVNELMQMKDVQNVSRAMEIPITIKYRGTEIVVTCTVLSQEYIEDAYGMKLLGSTKRFYMNEAAFNAFCQDLSERNAGFTMEQEQADGNMEYDISYSEIQEASEEGDSVSFQSAKIVVVRDGILQEEPLVFMAEHGSRLSKEAVTIWVLFGKHDLDGLHVKKLRKMRYLIKNEDMIMAEEYEMKIRTLHIRYGLFSCVICLTAVLTLWHLVRK